jgi:hypothetical protein
MSARSCVSAAIATCAVALANMGDSNSDCGNMMVVADPGKTAKTKGAQAL